MEPIEEDEDEVRRRGAGGTPGGIGEFLVGLAMAVAGAYMLRQRVVFGRGVWAVLGYTRSGCSIFCIEPRFLKILFLRRSPTPGMAVNSDVKSRSSRRLRWYVTAERCVSSRINWMSRRTGECESKYIGSCSRPFIKMCETSL